VHLAPLLAFLFLVGRCFFAAPEKDGFGNDVLPPDEDDG
jgi:hypothetical protein